MQEILPDLVKNSSPSKKDLFFSSSSKSGNCFSFPFFRLMEFLDPAGFLLYNRICPCERGGTGRRTGFRILRFMHKGSSPFARTKKGAGKKYHISSLLLYFLEKGGIGNSSNISNAPFHFPFLRKIRRSPISRSRRIPEFCPWFHHPPCGDFPECRRQARRCGRWTLSFPDTALPERRNPQGRGG